MAKTGDDLLNAVRSQITAPNNQILLTDDRVLEFANEQIEALVTPYLVSLRQDYFVRKEYQVTVTNQENYPIPYRAIGRTLRDLKIIDGTPDINGQIAFGLPTRDLAMIALEDASLTFYNATPAMFYFRGDEIIILPTPMGVGQTIEKWYLLRPNAVVTTSQAAKIVGISGTTFTCTFVPNTITAGSSVDFIQGRQGNQTIAMDMVVQSVTGQQLTITSPLPVFPPTVKVGDYIALAEQSPLIQLPDEAFTLIVAHTSARCLEAISDFEGKQAIVADIPEKKRVLQMILAPRMEGENMKVIQRFSLLRGNRTRFRRGIIY